VKSINAEQDKDTKIFASIMDTVRYFSSKGINLDRKILNNKIENGKPYKGYIFQYKNN